MRKLKEAEMIGDILIRNRIFYIASKYLLINKVSITMGKLAT